MGTDYRLSRYVPSFVFASVTGVLFGGPLLQSAHRVLGPPNEDMLMGFLPTIAFGFGQLRHGHLPLWNPYLFCGSPALGNCQLGLLYPPNWLHLVLPATVTVNIVFALHVFLAGWAMSMWIRTRGGSIAAATLAGVAYMLCGQLFRRIYAGHLPHVCFMVWPPLLLLVIDRLAETGRLRWALAGAGVVAMSILAGQPQLLYYTGLVSGAYVGLLLLRPRARYRWATVTGWMASFVLGVLLTAIQLFPAIQGAGEAVRAGGTPLWFASMFSFPPDNLLTSVIPDLFGTFPLGSGQPMEGRLAYFGQCNPWEASAFIGVGTLVLALLGAAARGRSNAPVTAMVAITLTAALGRHLPFYLPLYRYLPMYGSFRGVCKLTLFTGLFVAALAGSGLDIVLAGRHPRTTWVAAGVTLAAALAVGFFAVDVVRPAGIAADLWTALLDRIRSAQEVYTPVKPLMDPAFYGSTFPYAASVARQATIVLAITAALLGTARFWRRPATVGLVALVVVEMVRFASPWVVTAPATSTYPTAWLTAIQATAKATPASRGPIRVVNSQSEYRNETPYINQGMALGFLNLWGYDPGVSKRVAELMFASQGLNAAYANQMLQFSNLTAPLFQALRCALDLTFSETAETVRPMPNPMPEAQLVPGWWVAPSMDAALYILTRQQFDPRRTVVLEQTPVIAPAQGGTAGPAEVVASGSDFVEIRAKADKPTLMLVTDAYSSAWRAVPVDANGPQPSYEVMPADHALMAIPLSAGNHHLRLEYAPISFPLGCWTSALSAVVYVGLWWRVLRTPHSRAIAV